ncbi:hypothetical protein HYX10_02460 [Candidatus Woesearchaeota archaeon]|nr:hypothetical protein [Candidatus Woesearchaeota archaeon]
MRKTISLLLLIFVIFIVGCQTQQPHLSAEGKTTDFITSKQEPFTMKFFLVNPTQNTFTGQIKYVYDKECLRGYPDEQDVEVTPQQYRIAITKDFEYYLQNRNDEEKCVNTPLQISATLQDKGGDIKSVLNVQLTISGS